MKDKFWLDAQAEYLKRLGRYAKVDVKEAQDEPCPDQPSEAEKCAVLQKEGAKILKNCEGFKNIVALTPEGERMSSEKFSKFIETTMKSGVPDICFIIGGSLGIDENIKRSARLISMSDMTFPHRLARIMLLEQVYRGFKIINNETYHK